MFSCLQNNIINITYVVNMELTLFEVKNFYRISLLLTVFIAFNTPCIADDVINNAYANAGGHGQGEGHGNGSGITKALKRPF